MPPMTIPAMALGSMEMGVADKPGFVGRIEILGLIVGCGVNVGDAEGETVGVTEGLNDGVNEIEGATVGGAVGAILGDTDADIVVVRSRVWQLDQRLENEIP